MKLTPGRLSRQPALFDKLKGNKSVKDILHFTPRHYRYVTLCITNGLQFIPPTTHWGWDGAMCAHNPTRAVSPSCGLSTGVGTRSGRGMLLVAN